MPPEQDQDSCCIKGMSQQDIEVQGTLEFAVQENLFGGGSAVAAIRKEFPNEANTGKRDPKSPAKGPIKHAKGGMPKYENRSNQMPGKPRQEGSRLTSDGAGNSKAGV